MKLLSYIVLFCLTLPSIASGNKKLPELFAPVDKNTYERLYADDEFYIRKELYFAKKHRIVTADTTLLLDQKNEFTITPMPGARFRIKDGHKAKRMNRTSSHWEGEQYAQEEVQTNDRELLKQLNTININVLSFSKLVSTSVEPHLPSISQQSGKKRINIWALHGNVDDWPSKKNYIIRPLPSNPEYHLVYLQDQEKTVIGIHQTDPIKAENLKVFLRKLEQEKAARKNNN